MSKAKPVGWWFFYNQAVGRSDGGSLHFHYQVWGRILIAQIQMIPPSLGISSAGAEAEYRNRGTAIGNHLENQL